MKIPTPLLLLVVFVANVVAYSGALLFLLSRYETNAAISYFPIAIGGFFFGSFLIHLVAYYRRNLFPRLSRVLRALVFSLLAFATTMLVGRISTLLVSQIPGIPGANR